MPRHHPLEKAEACLENTVPEEEHFLLAHRGRRGEEESWSTYLKANAEEPPSPPPSAKVRRTLVDQEYNDFVAEQSEDSNDASQAVVNKVLQGWISAEQKSRIMREEIVQRRRDLSQNEHSWCSADIEKARTELADISEKQRTSNEEGLKLWTAKEASASHADPASPAGADGWYGKYWHQPSPPTSLLLDSGADKEAKTLEPPESAPGAHGAKVVPLLQLFDMKAHNAQYDAQIAANPGGLAAFPSLHAKQGDWLTERARWQAGYRERLDSLHWSPDQESSYASSSNWEANWWQEPTQAKGDTKTHHCEEEGAYVKQNTQQKFVPWAHVDSQTSSATKQVHPTRPAPSSSKRTAPAWGEDDHLSVASSGGEKYAEAPRSQASEQAPWPPWNEAAPACGLAPSCQCLLCTANWRISASEYRRGALDARRQRADSVVHLADAFGACRSPCPACQCPLCTANWRISAGAYRRGRCQVLQYQRPRPRRREGQNQCLRRQRQEEKPTHGAVQPVQRVPPVRRHARLKPRCTPLRQQERRGVSRGENVREMHLRDLQG
jgi:hypothetical protein